VKSSFQQAGSAIFWRGFQHVGVKLIFLVRLVVLTRLLSPEDFGLIAIASIVIDVLMRVTHVGMVQALIQRIVVEEQHYDIAWTVGMIRALSITLVTFFSAPLVAQFFGEPRVEEIVRILALRPLIDAAASIKIAELTRNLKFRSMAIIELPKALANTMIAVALAKQWGAWALVVGTLAGSTTYLWLSYFLAPHRPRFSFDTTAARSLIRFGRWVFFTSLVVMAGQLFLRVIISRQLGAAELGLYYLAASLAFLPVEVASEIIGEVTFPLYARIQTDIWQTALTFRTIMISLAVLIVPALFLMTALAPSLVVTVLGPEWIGAAPIIQILALANLLGLLGETIVPILNGTGHPDKVLVIEVVQSSLLISSIGIFASRFGVIGAALAWLPAIAASQAISSFFIHKLLPRPFTGVGLPLGVLTITSALAALSALRIASEFPGPAGFAFASAFGVAITGALLWTIERRYRLGLSDGLVRAFPRLAAVVGFTHREAA
jgi:O-antigen/teichoic acid export membrane protein